MPQWIYADTDLGFGHFASAPDKYHRQSMLEQRIQQHFIDSADVKYQSAQALSDPINAAVQALLACVTNGSKVLACGAVQAETP